MKKICITALFIVATILILASVTLAGTPSQSAEWESELRTGVKGGTSLDQICKDIESLGVGSGKLGVAKKLLRVFSIPYEVRHNYEGCNPGSDQLLRFTPGETMNELVKVLKSAQKGPKDIGLKDADALRNILREDFKKAISYLQEVMPEATPGATAESLLSEQSWMLESATKDWGFKLSEIGISPPSPPASSRK